MNKEEAFKSLQEEFARYTVKYPSLCVKLSSYISQQPDKLQALASCIYKLMSVDSYINEIFFNILE